MSEVLKSKLERMSWEIETLMTIYHTTQSGNVVAALRDARNAILRAKDLAR